MKKLLIIFCSVIMIGCIKKIESKTFWEIEIKTDQGQKYNYECSTINNYINECDKTYMINKRNIYIGDDYEVFCDLNNNLFIIKKDIEIKQNNISCKVYTMERKMMYNDDGTKEIVINQYGDKN